MTLFLPIFSLKLSQYLSYAVHIYYVKLTPKFLNLSKGHAYEKYKQIL